MRTYCRDERGLPKTAHFATQEFVPMSALLSAGQRLPFRENACSVAGVFPKDANAPTVIIPAEALQGVAFKKVAPLGPAERSCVPSPRCHNGLAQVGWPGLPRPRLDVAG